MRQNGFLIGWTRSPVCFPALEAIAGAHEKPEKEPVSVTGEAIREWFREADGGEISDRQEVPPPGPGGDAAICKKRPFRYLRPRAQ